MQPWTSWRDALKREVNWYLKCPVTNGYPNFVAMTFMRDDYHPRLDRPDFIPATQNGMGIISYLKYHAWTGRKNPKLIAIARAMGDYLVKEDLTPDEGKYPRFPALDRHSPQVPAAAGLRVAGGPTLRNPAGQGRDRRLRAGAALQSRRRTNAT